MSSDHSLSVTLKAGNDFSSPWIVVYGDNPSEVEAKLNDISGLVAATVEAANLLKAANNAAPLLTGGAEAQAAPAPAAAPAAPAAPAGWGNAPQGGGGGRPRGQAHPEGKTCAVCSNVLELKKTSTGKSKWQCDAWRWNNGNPNGHTSEWIN